MVTITDPYTHYFVFELGDRFIRGELEFDTDNKASFRIKEWSEPLPAEFLNQFTEWVELLRKLDEVNGGIKRVGVILKPFDKKEFIKKE